MVVLTLVYLSTGCLRVPNDKLVVRLACGPAGVVYGVACILCLLLLVDMRVGWQHG
jgi:hypothetical protein